jgi:putative ABC transport system substrate-binding protein
MLALALLNHTVYAAPLNVSVVLSEEGGAYQEFSESLRSKLANQDIILRVTTMREPVRDSDLIIAVGMKAATAVATLKPSGIFNVFIPKEGYTKLQLEFLKRSPTFSAIYLEQPIERQIGLIKAVLPNIHEIGILYTTPPKDLRILRLKALDQGLTLHEQIVTPEISLSSALQNLLHETDTLFALPDADIYNVSTIRNILLASYRAQIPVIGFSSSFVRAGGLCAIFSTPGQVASQTVDAIQLYAETGSLPAAQYSREFDVMINTQVSRSLGLKTPGASEVHDKIGGDL